MPWQDRLTRARFRDFEFLTESHAAKYGRRLAVHEYPGADVPRVEDFGEKAGGWGLDAYFIGPDYDQRRNEFLALLNEPGPGWLVHPWLGALWVRPSEWQVSESTDKGGFCTVKAEFVPGGEELQPDFEYGDVAVAACRALAAAAVGEAREAPMLADSLGSFIAAVGQRLEGLRMAISLASLPLAWAAEVLAVIEGVKGDLAALALMPQGYANAFLGIANALGLNRLGAGDDGLTSPRRAALAGRVAGAAGIGRRAVALTGAAAKDPKLAAALRDEYALEQRLLAAAAMAVAVAQYATEADRDFALAAVNGAAGALLPSAPDTVFFAAENARAAVTRVLLGQDIRPSVRRDIVHPLPACVVAHRLGVPEAAFLARNAVRHPLFVNGAVYG
jgi:prophage DNA circulation protein